MDAYTEPDPEGVALLTIDVQRDFVLSRAGTDTSAEAPGILETERLVESFRGAGAPIVHVVRLYETDGANVDRTRRRTIESGAELVSPGTDGAELVEELLPAEAAVDGGEPLLDAEALLDGEFQELGPDEWVMYKPRWGAFYDTDLEDFLRERDVNTVVVCGCNFPNCPRTTVYEASERDFRVVFVSDATSGTYGRGLAELENIGVRVDDADGTIEWLG